MGNFQKRTKQIPFTQVDNELLNAKDLSFKEKGLYAYLVSKPDGWRFSADRIVSQTADGRKAVLSGLRSLIELGLLEREKKVSGRCLYILKDYRPKCQIGTFGYHLGIHYLFETFQKRLEPPAKFLGSHKSPKYFFN